MFVFLMYFSQFMNPRIFKSIRENLIDPNFWQKLHYSNDPFKFLLNSLIYIGYSKTMSNILYSKGNWKEKTDWRRLQSCVDRAEEEASLWRTRLWSKFTTFHLHCPVHLWLHFRLRCSLCAKRVCAGRTKQSDQWRGVLWCCGSCIG